jgi:predicted transcriptional regulator of viral defense system
MAATRTVPAEDARVLHVAAQRGKLYLRWPEDRAWLERIPDIGDPQRRLQGMRDRGSLATVIRNRWVILPAGASSIEQAATTKVLLAALFEDRVDWYLGYLSALIDHRLTDLDSETLYVGIRGRRMDTEQRLGDRPLRIVHHTRDDAWEGVERQRAHGRVFSYRSDVERTLLDTLAQPRHCGPAEVWVRAWERAMREQRADLNRLADYAEQRSDVVQARLAFWLRETGHPRESRRVMRGLGGPLAGSRSLDASRSFGEGPWRRDRETGLLVNMPQEVIDGWLEYGK